MAKKKYPVEFACDEYGSQRAPMHECVASKIKKFDTQEEAALFASTCTHVYNLNEAYGNPPELKDTVNPILNSNEYEKISI